jgi:hypothetical protein
MLATPAETRDKDRSGRIGGMKSLDEGLHAGVRESESVCP